MIRIGMDPNIISTGTFVLSWHGVLTFVAVALGIYLVARWAGNEAGTEARTKAEEEAKRKRLDAAGTEQVVKKAIDEARRKASDMVYSVAIWAVIGGILGARLVHVIDRWDFYSHNLGQIVAIWNGGIAILGAVLGGFAGGALYARLKGYHIGKLSDMTAPALVIAMAFGRIGDIINGEHLSKTTTMPWGFAYTHPDSPSNQVYGPTPTHPTVVYEMIWDMVALGILWRLKGRLHPPGMLFVLFLALYSLGRFFISFLREDKIWLGGLSQAQLIAIVILAVTIPLLVYKAQFVKGVGAVVSKASTSKPAKG